MPAGGWVGAAACWHALHPSTKKHSSKRQNLGGGKFCLFEENLLLLLA